MPWKGDGKMRRSVFALGMLAALVWACAAFGQSVYTPISLRTSSFNEDVVIELTATTPLKSSITATMDNGEGLGGDTWFESGLPLANKPNVGFPAGAGVVTTRPTRTQLSSSSPTLARTPCC